MQEDKKVKEFFESSLDNIRLSGLYKNERIITSPQNTKICVKNQHVLNFCANNYLGLSNDERVVQAAKETLDSHGFGLSSVRFICGTQDIHIELEKKISQFHKTDDAILYASCFDANTGFFETFLTKEDAIFSDQLNHASIIDGIRLCKAQRFRFLHRDMENLEEQLKNCTARLKVIATDGSFSMTGNISPLDKIVQLAEKYNAITFVDECHSVGCIGPNGRGTPDYYNLEGRIDVISNTLGKALGGATGGYLTGKQYIIDMMRQKSRPYLFSNSLAPCLVGASLEVFDIIEESSELTNQMRDNVFYFRNSMTNAGFKCMGSPEHPIVAIQFETARLATDVANEMLVHGIYVIAFSYPVVPKESPRIRIQLSAIHTREELDKCINTFILVAKKFDILPRL